MVVFTKLVCTIRTCTSFKAVVELYYHQHMHFLSGPLQLGGGTAGDSWL